MFKVSFTSYIRSVEALSKRTKWRGNFERKNNFHRKKYATSKNEISSKFKENQAKILNQTFQIGKGNKPMSAANKISNSVL